jgi:hypothetical protein
MKCRPSTDLRLRLAKCGLRIIAATRKHGPRSPHHAVFSACRFTRYAGYTLHGTRRTVKNTPRVILLVLALSLSGPASRAFGQTTAYELCIEQSPAAAGVIEPDSGTHRFSADSVVTLSAQPQPGYQFAYWLGDVADPKASRTTVQLNAPKVIVAVFRPTEKDHLDEINAGAAGGGGGGGGLLPTFTDLSTPGWSPAGGPGAVRSTTRTIVIPVLPTPEPATVVLLALGALALRRTRTTPAR